MMGDMKDDIMTQVQNISSAQMKEETKEMKGKLTGTTKRSRTKSALSTNLKPYIREL